MPNFVVTNPAGKKFTVTAPAGATQDQAMAFAQANWPKQDDPETVSKALKTLHDDFFLTPQERAAEAKTRPTNASDLAADAIFGVGEEVSKQAYDAGSQLLKDFKPPTNQQELENYGRDMVVMPGVKTALDAAGLAMTPVTGALTSLVGRPLEHEFGIRRNVTGDVASMLIPGVGEETAAAKLSKAQKLEDAFQARYVGRDIADAAQKAEHQQSVKALRDAGVQLTPGQIRGERASETEQALSRTWLGVAHREGLRNSIKSYNLALYKKVLEPLGLQLQRLDVGRDAIRTLGNQVSAAYDRLKPYLRIPANDDKLIDEISRIRKNEYLLETQHKAGLEQIINEKILNKLNAQGGIDGETFKAIESDLTHISADLHGGGSGDKELAKRVDELRDALTNRMEETAPAGVREQLKKVNTSWAMLRRVEEAAVNRSGGLGVATTQDVLTSVSRAARKYEGKRAFARGDALMQDIAEHGHRILAKTVGDSGTQLRTWVQDPRHMALDYAGRKVLAPAMRPVVKARAQPGLATTFREAAPPVGQAVQRYATAPLSRGGMATNLANQLNLPGSFQVPGLVAGMFTGQPQAGAPPPPPAAMDQPGETAPVDPMQQQQQEMGPLPQ